VLEHLTRIPKIVGGVCLRSAERAGRFYGEFLGAPIINVNTLEAAEFAKLAGMIYRDVNIALANELSAYAEATGIDFHSTRAASNTDGEAHLLVPGIGVGGHCTPIYPNFVLRDAERLQISMPLTANARRINDGQAERMLHRLEATAGPLQRKQVLILGLAFRPEVKEHTKSPAFLVRQAAEARGAKVFLHDPLYSDCELRSLGFMPMAIQSDSLPSVVILVTGHSAYAQMNFASWQKRGVRYVLDGRCFWDPTAVCKAGISYIAPGLPIPTEDGFAGVSEKADVVTKGSVFSEA
jgi:nucleotide sugar dehydrogenase